MINFRFTSAHLILDHLNRNIQVSHRNKSFEGPGNDLDNSPKHQTAMSQATSDIRFIVNFCPEYFADLKSAHILSANDSLRYWLENKSRSWSELNTRARALRDIIETELSEMYYYQYPKNFAQEVISWEELWFPAIKSFPLIAQDAFEATDCYALQHYTASVFHCMRVLEHGLRAIAADVGLTFDLQQWNNIIEEIEAKITELRKSLRRGLEKNERMKFLSEAAKEFFYFKDGWRNHVSHNRGRYDEHQAISVLGHVRSFMNLLATRLSE